MPVNIDLFTVILVLKCLISVFNSKTHLTTLHACADSYNIKYRKRSGLKDSL